MLTIGKSIFIHFTFKTKKPLLCIPVVFWSCHKTQFFHPMFFDKMINQPFHTAAIIHKQIICSDQKLADTDNRTMAALSYVLNNMLSADDFLHRIKR